jgi:hypothetical protein
VWKKYLYRSFRETLTAKGKVAVLAVDPIVRFPWKHPGDKTRMEELVKDKMPLSVHQLQEKHWVWLEKHENQSAFAKPAVLILI